MGLPQFNTRTLTPEQVNTLPAAPQPTTGCVAVALASDHAPIPVIIPAGAVNLVQADLRSWILSIAVGIDSARILPYDGARTSLSLTNSGAAPAHVNLVGGDADEGAPFCVTIAPGYGIKLDGALHYPISAAADDDTQLTVVVSNSSGLDPLLDLLLDAMPDAVSAARRLALGAALGRLRREGLLDFAAVLALPMAFETQANALVNLARPSVAMSLQAASGGSAPTFDSGSFVGSGSGWISTGITLPEDDFRAADACMFAYVRTPATKGAGEYVMGYGSGALQANRSATQTGMRAQFTTNELVNLPPGRFWAWNRRSESRATGFSGASRAAIATPVNPTINPHELLALAVNSTTGATGFSTNRLDAFGALRNVSDDQVAILGAVLDDLAAAVGAT